LRSIDLLDAFLLRKRVSSTVSGISDWSAIEEMTSPGDPPLSPRYRAAKRWMALDKSAKVSSLHRRPTFRTGGSND
jgi:hypothetical protein